jgi:small GTP-binding protein
MEQNENQNLEKNKEINNDITNDFEILPRDYPKFDYNYKIIVIGDSGVGKTCLTLRASTGEFHTQEPPTLGFEYLAYYLKYQNKILKLEIWDTCGQEQYRSLIKSFFSNSSLAIIAYAIDDKKSFDSVDEWVRQCKTACSPETKFFLIGNKADLIEE